MNKGNSVLNPVENKENSGHFNFTTSGGSSGAVISPAPGLGLSSYQDPSVKALPSDQGEN